MQSFLNESKCKINLIYCEQNSFILNAWYFFVTYTYMIFFVILNIFNRQQICLKSVIYVQLGHNKAFSNQY